MKLDKALDKLPQPTYEGQVIKRLPCDLCNRLHTKTVAVNIDGLLVWEIHSPCLDKIAKRAAQYIQQIS